MKNTEAAISQRTVIEFENFLVIYGFVRESNF